MSATAWRNENHGVPRVVVVVSGLPGSGKTTLSRRLSDCLGWPLIAKDAIKEALGDALDVMDEEGSRQLGKAAYGVMYALAGAVPGPVIVESNFTAISRPAILDLGAPAVIEVFCRCPVELAVERYNSRVRHPVHHSLRLEPAELERRGTQEPVDFGGPVVVVDTVGPVSADEVAQRIRLLASGELVAHEQ